jgi:hypothetical protein
MDCMDLNDGSPSPQNPCLSFFAECHYVNVPIDRMRVGTLDKLMVLSDDLVKVDTTFESIVRRIERQHMDLNPENPGNRCV